MQGRKIDDRLTDDVNTWLALNQGTMEASAPMSENYQSDTLKVTESEVQGIFYMVKMNKKTNYQDLDTHPANFFIYFKHQIMLIKDG